MNQRITQEINDLIRSVSSQIKMAISEAINEQVLPQIQATLRSGQEQVPSRGWEVPGRRPGCRCRSEEVPNCKFRSSLRDEFPRNFKKNEDLENTQYTILPHFQHFAITSCSNFNLSHFHLSTRTVLIMKTFIIFGKAIKRAEQLTIGFTL